MKISYLFTCITVLAFFSCKKKHSIDPNRYIKCKVNGKEWAATNNEKFVSKVDADWSHDGTFLTINGVNGNTILNIGIGDVKELQSGVYKLGFTKLNFGWYQDYDKSDRFYYTTDSNYIGTLIINIDKSNSRVFGGFSFKAKFQTSDEIVDVTDGTFNMPCHF